jgi:MscS family membrane protein
MATIIQDVLAAGNAWLGFIDFEIIRGNPAWRFALVLIGIMATMALARTVQFMINSYTSKLEKKIGETSITSLLKALTKPIFVGIFAFGFNACRLFLYFDADNGLSPNVELAWLKIAEIVGTIAIIYALYQLVSLIEHYMLRVVSTTETKLDDMLVPVIRKSIRITIAIVGTLFIAQSVLSAEKIKTLFLGAGLGGLAIAMAAKDTIANFFGSITIFADRPFHIDDLVKVGEHYGSIEEVGFRSTRIRTLDGHLVTIPNNTIANADIENVGRRPFIRRTSNITITYDSGSEKTKKAVEIIKEVLAEVPEVNSNPGQLPRVYFSDFNDWALNIYMSYWVKPPDYWKFQEVNERVNFEIMKRFEAEKIEFAFPSQTLYMKKDENV